MELFDKYLNSIENLLAPFGAKRFVYNRDKIAPITDKFELILQSDSAYELGGGNNKAVGLVTVTEKQFDSETIVYGKDLSEIKGDTSFAKIVILSLKDMENDEQKFFDLIKELEFVKYKYNVEGFMSRCSGITKREQVRVSKKALKKGLNFESIGNSFIKKYLEFENVKAVKIIYVTESNVDYDSITETVEKIDVATRALNHILDNINLDCAHCNLKPICDEVDGMKELHIKTLKK